MFKKNSKVKLISIQEKDKEFGLKLNQKGVVLYSNSKFACVNFIDNNKNFEECLNKDLLYAYPIFLEQLEKII